MVDIWRRGYDNVKGGPGLLWGGGGLLLTVKEGWAYRGEGMAV